MKYKAALDNKEFLESDLMKLMNHIMHYLESKFPDCEVVFKSVTEDYCAVYLVHTGGEETHMGRIFTN